MCNISISQIVNDALERICDEENPSFTPNAFTSTHMFKCYFGTLADEVNWGNSVTQDAQEFLVSARRTLAMMQKMHDAVAKTPWAEFESHLKKISPINLRKEALWKTVHDAYLEFGDIMYDSEVQDSNDQLADAVRQLLGELEGTVQMSGELARSAAWFASKLSLNIDRLQTAMSAAESHISDHTPRERS